MIHFYMYIFTSPRKITYLINDCLAGRQDVNRPEMSFFRAEKKYARNIIGKKKKLIATFSYDSSLNKKKKKDLRLINYRAKEYFFIFL